MRTTASKKTQFFLFIIINRVWSLIKPIGPLKPTSPKNISNSCLQNFEQNNETKSDHSHDPAGT